MASKNNAYPQIGFGTYPLKSSKCTNAVRAALKLGYTLIDTATFYYNFNDIGIALNEVDREKITLVSKVWPKRHTAEGLKQDIEETLEGLMTEYLDVYLLHWPNSRLPFGPVVEALNCFIEEGFVREVGLSNVSLNHVKKAMYCGMPVKHIQNEANVFFYYRPLWSYCAENGIVQQAWAPLARGKVKECKKTTQISEKYGKSVSQVALRWLLQMGFTPLPGSSKPEHIKENFDVLDFKLTQEEMLLLDEQAVSGKRFRLTPEFGFGFSDEFDFKYEECWPKD